jgi:alkylation response protein AidB-like acyl-CoA dehydrogenase
MGVRGMPEADVVLTGCRVPVENLLVSAGGGFQRLMQAYNMQRIGAAAIALGVAQGAFDLALGFAGERRQFGRPIGEFQGLRWMLADMHVQLEAARLLVHRAAANAGRGFPDTREVAVAKLWAAEAAIVVTNAAMQIHGALGYSCDLPVERMVRDARMYAIGGGTTQILRNVIAARLLPRERERRSR